MSVDRDLPPSACIALFVLFGVIGGAFIGVGLWFVGWPLIAVGGFFGQVAAIALGVEIGVRRANR